MTALDRVRGSRLVTPLGWLLLAAAIAACVVSLKLWADWQFTVAARFSDWQTAANAVARALDGQPLYTQTQLRGPYYMTDTVLKGWTYTPASVVALIPFGSQPAGLYAWIVLNVGLYVGGLAAILRRELGSFLPWPLALVLLGLAAFRPFEEGVVAGNVNVALAGLYALCWASDERSRWMAPAAGLAATFKVFPGLIVLWPMRAQGLRPLFVAAGVAIALSLLSLPIMGVDAWRDFVKAILNAQPPCQSYNAMSFACFFAPVTGATIGKLVGYAVVAVCAVGVLRVRDRFRAFVLLGGALLAGVTDMHLHFWVFGYVVLVVALARAEARRRDDLTGLPAVARDRGVAGS